MNVYIVHTQTQRRVAIADGERRTIDDSFKATAHRCQTFN